MEKQFYSKDEAANLLTISKRTLEKEIARGEISLTYLTPGTPRLYYRHILEYADRKAQLHNVQRAGPGVPKEGACRASERKGSSNGQTRRSGGPHTPTRPGSAIDDLLASG